MPSRIGRYAVRRRIGSGGFATVWLAYDEQLDSPVAVKVLAENWTEDHHVRQRFLEEGRFLRKVESPHVVSVYDAGELDDGRPYLVMSYADQGTLADRLEIDGLTPPQALEVVRQIGLGLTALHERGVLHRDVKPANVLFRTVDTRDGEAPVRAMLADLGLGKALDVSSRLTMIAGTPSFVAPEQAQGEPLDARADQYALGALTHLLLTGEPRLPARVAVRRVRPRPAAGAVAARPGVPGRRSTPSSGVPSTRTASSAGPTSRRTSRRSTRRSASTPAAPMPRALAADRPEPHPARPAADRAARPTTRCPTRTRPGRAPADGCWWAPPPWWPSGQVPRRATSPTGSRTARSRSSDATGSLSVTRAGVVDGATTRTGQWTPPDQDDRFPSLSAGTGPGWSSGDRGGRGHLRRRAAGRRPARAAAGPRRRAAACSSRSATRSATTRCSPRSRPAAPA